jgi:hypothetical protein
MKTPARRALFAISSLGLGHATRSLIIIKHYLDEGWHITIISSGNSLEMMRHELSDRDAVSFIDMPDYPPLERGTGWRLYWYLLIDLFITWRLIRYEHKQLQAIESGFDFIFSDGRYGFCSRNTPCFILTHQVAFMPPPLLKKAFWLTKYINLLALQRFDVILIPDYPSPESNLSGALSHSRLLCRYSHKFIGVLSSYRHQNRRQDIDLLFIISGYLVEHKKTFLHNLLMMAATIPGKKVFILGQQNCPDLPPEISLNEEIIIYPLAKGEERQELFNRSKLIIGRAGYSTIMDLVEHDKPGLLFPTPNQTEQEYLADYVKQLGYFEIGLQDQPIDLEGAVTRSLRTDRFKPPWRTEESLKKLKACIEPLIHQTFISIIVPAHNEEIELPETLNRLLQQDYPANRYEIILVENGSTDSTLSVAKRMIRLSGNRKLSVLQSRKGVSQAKNHGLAHVDPQSEWVVFCDADTHLGPYFLKHLNTKLVRTSENLSIGTCQILPRDANSRLNRLWFTLYDHIHHLTKTSYSLQIARTCVAKDVGFYDKLELAEDLLFIRDCMQHGSFFFLLTDQAATSTRRFDSVGYVRLSLFWMVGALLPKRFKLKLKYHAIR